MRIVVSELRASVLALLVLAAEVWFVLKRNRQIKVKGKDDFFSFARVLYFLYGDLSADSDGDAAGKFSGMW